MAHLQNDVELLSPGFPNLRVIQRSIADLHRLFPGPALLGLQFPASLSPAIIDAAMGGDPVVSAERIVATMVRHYHLPATVVVRFNDDMKEAGRISATANGRRLVEIHARYQGSGQIVPVLAHEIAHYFLDTHRVYYDDTFENECLTDTTANYLGAGWSILGAYEFSTSQRFGLNTPISITGSKLGYLTPEEFGYVLARRCNVTREDVAPWIQRREGKAALSAGFAQLRRELAQPPLATAGGLSRLKYKYAVLRSKTGGGPDATRYDYGTFSIEAGAKKSVLFRCPRCTQQLRFPVGIKRADVTCNNCKDQFVCSS